MRVVLYMVIGTVLIGSSVFALGGTAIAQDDFPDNCDNAPVVRGTSIQTGSIDSPGDRDTFRVQLDNKGTYVSVVPRVPSVEGVFELEPRSLSGSYSIFNATIPDGVDFYDDGLFRLDDRDGINIEGGNNRDAQLTTQGGRVSEVTSYELWAEGKVDICFRITDNSPQDVQALPYEWEIQLRQDSSAPVSIEDVSAATTGNQTDQEGATGVVTNATTTTAA